MVDITLSDKSADAIAADATVVLTAPTKDGARVIDPVGVSPAAVKALNEALATLEAKGRADEVLRLSGAGDLSGLVIAVGSGVDAEQAPTKASASSRPSIMGQMTP